MSGRNARHVLVTGAAGFIGSHLAEALLRDGRTVVGLDSFDDFYDPARKERNVAVCLAHPRFRLVRGDIRDDAALGEALSGGVTAVVHLAARAGVRPSIAEPVLYQDVNVLGTTRLLEAMRRRGITRLVFASSSSVYGDRQRVPFSEADPVEAPISPYAATKRAGELLCHVWHHLHAFDVTALRFFTVYGPRQRPDLAIAKFCRLLREGKPLPFYGDGSSERDHTYVDDIVQGVAAALDRLGGYRIYNLGESRPIRLDALVAAIEQAVGCRAVLERLPMQPGDVRRTCADVSRARADLGYEPRTALETGLARYVRWLDGSP